MCLDCEYAKMKAYSVYRHTWKEVEEPEDPANCPLSLRGAGDLPARDEGSPIALSLHQSDCHTEKPQVRDMILHQTVTYFLRETSIGHAKL